MNFPRAHVTIRQLQEIHRATHPKRSDKPPAAEGGGYATPCVSYGHNKSWVSAEAGGAGYSNVSFDAIGRVTGATQSTTTTSVKSFPFQASYNPSVGIKSITYPISNRVVTTTYNSGGRPSTLSGQIGTGATVSYVTSTTYQPQGAILSQALANCNLTLTRNDNARLQPTNLTPQEADLSG